MKLEHRADLDLQGWVAALIERYAVEAVYLVGSRASGTHGPLSDYDVAIALDAGCYPGGVHDGTEGRIVSDPALRNEAVDYFFLRPDGTTVQWLPWHIQREANAAGAENREAVEAALQEWCGIFSRVERFARADIYPDWLPRKCIYKRKTT